MARSDKKWDAQLKIAIASFEAMEKFKDDYYMIEEFSKAYRNPIGFDNMVKGATKLLDYKIPIPNGEKKTNDHLIGLSNIIAYIFKLELYKKWRTINDFKNTLSALQIMVTCSKSLNDSKEFKKWLFPYNTIEKSIQWNEKLKKSGIYYLVNDDGEKIDVDVVWSEWFKNNIEYLR
jgi:hypothetical protein